jgi:signal peptidase I
MNGENLVQEKFNSLWHKVTYVFLDMVQTVVMALAVFVVVYLFLFQPNQVKGHSMVPTLEDGEYLLTDKLTYRWVRKPEKGDIVVFKAPENEDYDFIKRIIALPGDTLEVRSGVVTVNGEVLDESYLSPLLKTNGGAFLKEGHVYTVPEGGYLVMGDNRKFSSDSREWGPVPEGYLIGRAWFRYWPPTRLGIITH